MSLAKVALAAASAVGAQAALRGLHNWNVKDVLGVMGLARTPRASERVIPTLGLILAGAAVGAGAALLLAPTSGTELRTRLSGRVDDAKHRLKVKLRDLERSEAASVNTNTNGG